MINYFLINSVNELTANCPTEYSLDSLAASAVHSSRLPAAPDNFSMSFINCSANDIFKFKSILSRDVSTAINALSTGKASAVNNISVTMLKKSSVVVAPILASLFNLSIATGTFPDCLKQALVVPVHKKGDTCEISNYRPIALLLTLSKLFEKLIHSQLSMFLVDQIIYRINNKVFAQDFRVKWLFADFLACCLKLKG